ncbi:hypothetical protein ACFLV3_04915 [Chloroflexota bacterium]
MFKFRIVYAVLLVLLGVLVVFTVFRPMASGKEYTEVLRDQLIQTEDGWIIQFTLLNHESEPKEYTINTVINGEQSSNHTIIPDGRKYDYIRFIPRETVTDSNLNVAIYKEGEDTPYKQGTYYLE